MMLQKYINKTKKEQRWSVLDLKTQQKTKTKTKFNQGIYVITLLLHTLWG